MRLLRQLICRYQLRNDHGVLQLTNLLPPESIVIPCTGAGYVEEAVLAAYFAAENALNAKEVVIVTDQVITADRLSDTTGKVRVEQLDPHPYIPKEHEYSNIYRARICKLNAPNYADSDRIMMIDSDLMLLNEPQLPWHQWGVAGSFRAGKLISKFDVSGVKQMPGPIQKVCRPYLLEHLNGAFLAAKKSVWEALLPKWLQYYTTIWSELPDNQPPTDQLPLACALDHLKLTTLNAGHEINWPVSKRIGGKHAQIPEWVVGAHGGFPLSEWEKYRRDNQAFLSFVDSHTTRKLRYQKANGGCRM
jgi:hypothetical protein